MRPVGGKSTNPKTPQAKVIAGKIPQTASSGKQNVRSGGANIPKSKAPQTQKQNFQNPHGGFYRNQNVRSFGGNYQSYRVFPRRNNPPPKTQGFKQPGGTKHDKQKPP